MTNNFNSKTVLVIGGSSGIGLAVAKSAAAAGASVIISGRSADKLAAAAEQMGSGVRTITANIAEPASVAVLFDKAGRIDHLAITGPAPNFGAFAELDLETVKTEFDGKFWGQWLAAQYAAKVLPPEGSITLMSGAYSQRPVPGASSLASVQAGIEGLVRALAVELSPLRVNAVSPGLTRTPLIEGVFGTASAQSLYDQTAAQLPARYVAAPEDIAQVYLFLMHNRVTTGSVLFPDGGYTLR
jgi:NAD(P)-dependent dehydrogenase (short-subunit alcohol dehydrogenase family)